MYVLFKFTEHTRPENEIIEILTPEIVEKLKTMIETKLGYVEIEVIKSAPNSNGDLEGNIIITQGVLYISLIFSSGNGEEQR
jgi:uncharacterized protein (UPF0212 family)